MLKVIPKSTTVWKGHKTVCVGISLHTANHCGEALEGLMHWTDQAFENILLDVSDTLYRHNYVAQGFSMEEAHDRALRDGNQWLIENDGLIHSCQKPVRIIRWDHWLQHPDFEKTLTQFRKAFEEQALFRESVIADAQSFYIRRFSSIDGIPEKVIECSINYLLEEISIHSIMYGENECAVLYPGKQHSCYKLVRAGKVSGVSDGLNNSSFTRMVIYNFDDQKQRA